MSPSQPEVPVIDLAAFRRGGADAAAVVAAVRDALERIGFLVVVGHGVDPAITREAYAAARDFFAQPDAAKLEVRIAPGGLPRGFLPYGTVALAQTNAGPVAATPPDLKESFALGPEALGRNRWPNHAGAAGLRAAANRCFTAMETVMHAMLDLFAAALELDPGYFRERFAGHDSTLRLFNYPALTQPPAPGQLRSGEHTDYGALTILSIGADDPGGLQVRTRSGAWVDVSAPPDSFVINIGDLLMMWSNDRWLSNLHRVVVATDPADPDRAMRARQSMGFFANPRAEVLIECLPGCADADRPPRHPPILAGEHRLAKVRKSAPARVA